MKNQNIKEIVKNGILEFFEETLDYYGTTNENAEYIDSFMHDNDENLSKEGHAVVEFWEKALDRIYTEEQIEQLHKNIENEEFFEALPVMVAEISAERREQRKNDEKISEVNDIGYEILCQLGVEHYGMRSFKEKVKTAKESKAFSNPQSFGDNSEPIR